MYRFLVSVLMDHKEPWLPRRENPVGRPLALCLALWRQGYTRLHKATQGSKAEEAMLQSRPDGGGLSNYYSIRSVLLLTLPFKGICNTFENIYIVPILCTFYFKPLTVRCLLINAWYCCENVENLLWTVVDTVQNTQCQFPPLSTLFSRWPIFILWTFTNEVNKIFVVNV